MYSFMRNKATFRCFQTGNGDWAGKQSQFKANLGVQRRGGWGLEANVLIREKALRGGGLEGLIGAQMRAIAGWRPARVWFWPRTKGEWA